MGACIGRLLLRNIMSIEVREKKLGLLLGGSGLIGGAITHYFKTLASDDIDLRAPSSKKLSIRVPDDIKQYFREAKPDFIINAAIASIDSDSVLAFETNYVGPMHLAKAAIALGIPYIHLSSAAVMPSGENLTEDQVLDLRGQLSNYAKSKLMAEMSLRHLGETEGLDYTIIRLAVVYGKHDHKIQGFQRLFFSVVDQAIPVLLTRPGVCHSYSNTKKLPPFISHILSRREEFGRQTYNFVDPDPVELAQVILAIKKHLRLGTPKEIYVPYRLAKTGKVWLRWIMRRLSRLGIVARMPAELIFLENFYRTQTLSCEKLRRSSYGIVQPEWTVFTEFPAMIEYYLTRWKHLNLITLDTEFYETNPWVQDFIDAPDRLLTAVHNRRCDLLTDPEEPVQRLHPASK